MLFISNILKQNIYIAFSAGTKKYKMQKKTHLVFKKIAAGKSVNLML